MIDVTLWRGRRVFITGHTGFKGAWLALWLRQLGASVYGYALDPPTQPSFFRAVGLEGQLNGVRGDVRDRAGLQRALQEGRPDVIVHLAAQSLVRESYTAPTETYSVNVMGTVNVLDAARGLEALSGILVITSDKCYDNREWAWGYREVDRLGGRDPYSNSKACAELVTSAYRSSFYHQQGVRIATARAGNVLGGGDWAADRLVPDLIRAATEGHPARVRNPLAIRPWQHVLEPLTGYLLLMQGMLTGADVAEAWNFGPPEEDAKSVRWVADYVVDLWGMGARWEADLSGVQPHEARMLSLDSSKARQRLGWRPRWRLGSALKHTVDWYRAFYSGAPEGQLRDVAVDQIEQYAAAALETESSESSPLIPSPT